MKKVILNIAKVLFTAGILLYFYNKGMLDFSKVARVFTAPAIFIPVLLLMFLTTIASVIRWRWLLLGQGFDVPFVDAFRLTMIGVFFNTAIPGAVSGDLVKGFYIVRRQPDGRGRIKAFSSLLMDRIMGLSALIFISFFAMFFHWNEMISNPFLKPLCGLIAILGFSMVAFFLFVLVPWSFSSKIKGVLEKLPGGSYFVKLYDAVKAYDSCPGLVFRGLMISFVIHFTIIGVCIVLAKQLGGFEMVPAREFFFLVPFGLLVTAVPIAPAGLGTGHAAFLGLFQLVGTSGGADLFTAFVAMQIIISLIGSFFYLRYRSHSAEALDTTNSSVTLSSV